MKCKRLLCLLLTVLMLCSLVPETTLADTTVYFTAVNDQLLSLSDDTMPFWSGGRLYFSSTAISGSDLGIFYSRSRDKQTAVVYRQGSALTFDLASGAVSDQNERSYSGAAIVRGDVVFLPVDLLTRFFALDTATRASPMATLCASRATRSCCRTQSSSMQPRLPWRSATMNTSRRTRTSSRRTIRPSPTRTTT